MPVTPQILASKNYLVASSEQVVFLAVKACAHESKGSRKAKIGLVRHCSLSRCIAVLEGLHVLLLQLWNLIILILILI